MANMDMPALTATQNNGPLEPNRSVESAAGHFARTELPKVVLFTVAFFFAYKYSSVFGFESPAPLWFPDSVLLCALLLVPTRQWLLYLLVTLPLRLALESNAPGWFLLPAFANDSLKAVLSAYVLRRVFPGSVHLNTLRQFFTFIAVAVVSVPALSAFAGAGSRLAAGFDFWRGWLQWFLGDAIAALAITPTLIYWCTNGWREASGHLIELAFLIAGTGVCLWFTFVLPHVDSSPIVLYAPVPFLIWAATRFGPTGASSIISVVALVSIVSAVEEKGPFSASYLSHSVVSMQLFLALVAAPVLFVAILTEERRVITEECRVLEANLRNSRAALEQNHRVVRDLLRRLIHAQEEERRRIARDLHDVFGQTLTSLKFDVGWIGRLRPDDTSATRVRMAEMITLIDETIGAVRRIATDLRPGVLDDLGLAAAVEWQGEEFEQRTGIRCALRVAVDEDVVDPLVATALFRIFQESLTNVARHSRASRVAVTLAYHGSDLVLEVNDDGVGIAAADASDMRSIGLAGMRERAQLVGGGLSIISAAGAGTTVRVEVPCRQAANT